MVTVEMRARPNGVGAQALGRRRGHGGVDAVRAGLVRCRGDDAAPVGATAYDHGLPTPFGVVELLDAREKRVEVHEQQRASPPGTLRYVELRGFHADILSCLCGEIRCARDTIRDAANQTTRRGATRGTKAQVRLFRGIRKDQRVRGRVCGEALGVPQVPLRRGKEARRASLERDLRDAGQAPRDRGCLRRRHPRDRRAPRRRVRDAHRARGHHDAVRRARHRGRRARRGRSSTSTCTTSPSSSPRSSR